jgi:hypothetical protein
MFQRLSYFTRPAMCLAAAMMLPLFLTGGCAFFKKETWNLNNYRDERAVDIDHRLEKADTGVKNPF